MTKTFARSGVKPVIDADFQAQIPPLSEDERTTLEANIVADGCLAPVIVWSTGNILLDGHNRVEICERRGVPYYVKKLDFETREAAEDWIDRNQLGRRNLNPEQLSLIRGRIYNRTKHPHGGDRKSNRQNDGLNGETAEALGKAHGVSTRTIERDGQFAAAVSDLKTIDPGIEAKVTSGQGPAKSAVVTAAKLLKAEPEKAREVLEEASKPKRRKPITQYRGKHDDTAFLVHGFKDIQAILVTFKGRKPDRDGVTLVRQKAREAKEEIDRFINSL